MDGRLVVTGATGKVGARLARRPAGTAIDLSGELDVPSGAVRLLAGITPEEPAASIAANRSRFELLGVAAREARG